MVICGERTGNVVVLTRHQTATTLPSVTLIVRDLVAVQQNAPRQGGGVVTQRPTVHVTGAWTSEMFPSGEEKVRKSGEEARILDSG